MNWCPKIATCRLDYCKQNTCSRGISTKWIRARSRSRSRIFVDIRIDGRSGNSVEPSPASLLGRHCSSSKIVSQRTKWPSWFKKYNPYQRKERSRVIKTPTRSRFHHYQIIMLINKYYTTLCLFIIRLFWSNWKLRLEIDRGEFSTREKIT